MKIEDMQTQAVNNAAVIQLFIMGQPGHAANLSTDGAVLRSYHYYELAIWATKDKVILRAGELYSQTTKKHMSLLRKALIRSKVEYVISDIETPTDEKLMRFTPSRAGDVEQETTSARQTTIYAQWDRFDICEAYKAVEDDYHSGGILHERKSNKRRNMSTDFQLNRMGFKVGASWKGYRSLSENAKAIYAGLCKRYGLKFNPYNLPMNDAGELEHYAWPGGYEIYYLDNENNTLCYECAIKPGYSTEPVAAGCMDSVEEDISCDDCGRIIETPYKD